MHRHNEFPFAPFFQVLSESGIKVTLDDYGRLSRILRCDGDWDIGKLRLVLAALLTKSPEEAKIFRRCFDDFFAAPSELLNQNDYVRALPTQQGAEVPATAPKDYFRYVNYLVLLVFLFAAFAFFPEVKSFGERLASIVTGPPGPSNQVASPQPKPTNQTVEPPKQDKQADNSTPFPPFLRRLALVLVIMAVVYGLVRMVSLSRDASDRVMKPSRGLQDSEPREFSLSANRGEQVKYLSENALDQIAKSIRYAMNETQTRKLDVTRSAAASARNGGLLSLVHQKRKELSEVGILVDAYAQPLLWNTVAEELGQGLSRRGVTVASGRFFGKLTHFRMDDGTLVSFEDLEDMRDALMLLIFSDGKHLDDQRDKCVLESLVRFRTASWFDLREPQFWDESTSLVARSRMPLFSANEKGLLGAVDYFLSEQGKQNKEADSAARMWRGSPEFVSGDLESYLEQLLGDALPWAQVCSVLQPLPMKFANALREKFQPHLPQERIERLFRLPGTWFDTAGLHFSRNTLSALRRGFSLRWDHDVRSEVLQFVLSAIEAAEPPEKESLRHLTWEWSVQRVRLDIEPDAALREIARLSHSPLGPHIREEMGRVLSSFDFYVSKQDMDQPLLVLPKTRIGKRIMTQFRDSESLDSGFWIRVEELTNRARSLWLTRLVIGFFRGFLEYLTTIYEFLTYFPYPAGCRDFSYYAEPGFRNLRKWF